MKSSAIRRGEEIIARCRQIANFTEIPGEITRTFLSPPMRGVHQLASKWMEAAGMTVRVDAVGNLRGLYPGVVPDPPCLLIGSHLDTVPNAGAFDGVLGVVLGIAVVEQLAGAKLPFAIEIIGFSEEEGVRFGKPFLGSLALVGGVDDDFMARSDARGIKVSEAIAGFGLSPADLPSAVFSPETFAYFEFHIEQGPVLDSESLPLGIVTAIAGQSRLTVTFTGQANHAGTTPMHLRHDAMAAAAEWITFVERYAKSLSDAFVATVGRVEAWPGAGNVIAGKVTASLDARHSRDSMRTNAIAALLKGAEHVATKRGVQVAAQTKAVQPAVHMSSRLTHLLHSAAKRTGYPSRTMYSGAGHDAMIVAPHVPSTMLFLRSPSGLSHHPDESVLPEDIDAALATAMEFLALLRDDKEHHA